MGSSPQAPRARLLWAPHVSFSICKMGRRARIKPPAALKGAGRTKPGCARAGRMLPGQRAGRTGERGPRAGRGAGELAQTVPRRRGRGGAARAASRRVAHRPPPSSPVVTRGARAPGRARPLHKRPPRQRRRTPTRSDPLREEEGAQRRRHSPPRCRRKSSPPPLQPLPPLTGNSCGLRATELAAVLVPPYGLSIGSGSPTPPVIGQRRLSLSAPCSGLLLTPSCPSRLSLGAPRQPRPSHPRRDPGLVARLGEPAPGAPPPTPLSPEPHVGRTALAAARNRRKCPTSDRL